MSPNASAVARGVLIVHLILSPLVFSGATLEAFESNKVALLATTALALVAISGLSLRPGIGRSAISWLREPVTLSVLALLISAIVSTGLSITPTTSFFGAPESCSGFTTAAAYAITFLATRYFCRTANEAIRLLGAVAIATALSAVFGLLQVIRADPFLWADASHVAGMARPFAGQGHANFLGAYLATAIPCVVALGIWTYRRGMHAASVVLGLVALASVTTLVATLSRGAWIALAVMIVAGAAFARRSVSLRWSTAAVICVVVIAFALRSSVSERLQHFGDSAGRVDLWRAGLEMWRDHPLTGVGLDAYQTAFGQYRPSAFWKLEWNTTPNKAHNDFIHVLATQGILGGLSYLSLVAALGMAFRRAWRQGDVTSRIVVAASALGLLAYVVQSQFSFTVAGCGLLAVTLAAVLARGAEGFEVSTSRSPEWRPSLTIALLFVALVFVMDGVSIGIASGWKLGVFASAMCLAGLWTANSVVSLTSDEDERPSPSAQVGKPWWLLRSAVAVASLAACWIWVVQPHRADRFCREADMLFEADPTAAVALYEKAVELAPAHDLYWAKLAEGCHRIETRPRTADERTRYGKRAHEAAVEAIRLAPLLAQRHALLGQILGDLAFDGLGRPDDALASFDKALSLDPRNAAILADAGRAAWGLNRIDAARAYLRRGLELDPSQANLTAISGSVAMAQGHFEEAEANFREARALDWHGDEDAQLHALAAWGACLARLNRPVEAETWLRYVLDRRPNWIAPRFTLAFSLTLSGRAGAVEEFRRVAGEAPNHPLATESRKWIEKLEAK